MRLIDADVLKTYIDIQEGRPFIGCTVGEALKIMVDEQPTIELAAERETTTVSIGKTRGGRTEWHECDNCGAPVHPEDRYCSECGRRLKVPSGYMHENLSYREK